MLTTSISPSIVFITFVFIVVCHATVKLVSLKICKDMRVRVVMAINNRKNGEEPEENELQHQAMDDDVMHTSIELNEPLLENNVSAS